MELQQLLQKKMKGDNLVIGAMLGITHENARQSLRNPKAPNHTKAVEALKKIIEARESLIEEQPFLNS